MIAYETLLSIPFLEKSRFTGSWRGMRYSIYRVEEEGAGSPEDAGDGEAKAQKEIFLEAAACPGPFSVDRTAPELFETERFSFDDAGRRAAIDWLNALYSRREEFFEDVYRHPERYYEKHHLGQLA